MALARSRTNKVFAGVLGGIAERTGMSANLLRIIFIILLIVTGFFPMGLAYLIAAFVLPKR
ncbi:PspC domain-containing protein [Bacillus sp. SG-1]|uniref:PspC domain-containing protein n=1 Tax=Bacillus sp. SG-1 TaxID=161544 RepID=UPI0002EB81E3|nr:PspC domain-containing protein [Bacillus sp. SG-1]